MADKTIKSPYPGTFYRRPSPGPILRLGRRPVAAGDVVGLVEIMKNFHEVTSDEEGVVARFLVESEDLVEAGQDLIALGD